MMMLGRSVLTAPLGTSVPASPVESAPSVLWAPPRSLQALSNVLVRKAGRHSQSTAIESLHRPAANDYDVTSRQISLTSPCRHIMLNDVTSNDYDAKYCDVI